MSPEFDADHERWRGSVTEKLEQIITGISHLTTKFESHEAQDNTRFASVTEEITSLKTKVSWWSGVAAAIGTGIGWAASWLAEKK